MRVACCSFSRAPSVRGRWLSPPWSALGCLAARGRAARPRRLSGQPLAGNPRRPRAARTASTARSPGAVRAQRPVRRRQPRGERSRLSCRELPDRRRERGSNALGAGIAAASVFPPLAAPHCCGVWSAQSIITSISRRTPCAGRLTEQARRRTARRGRAPDARRRPRTCAGQVSVAAPRNAAARGTSIPYTRSAGSVFAPQSRTTMRSPGDGR